MNRYLIAGAVLAVLVTAGATVLPAAPADDSRETEVVTSFYPFYTITQQVAGDAATVDSLVPPGTEPHGYDPAPGAMAKTHSADVYVTTGAGFAAWEDRILSGVPDRVQTVDASNRVQLIAANHGHGTDAAVAVDHEQGADPHYWLAPTNAITITENVRDGLIAADPAHAATYEENAAAFIQKLEALDAQYAERLQDCKRDRIVTTHASFAYLGEAYGFEQVPIHGLSPISEPTPQQLERLHQVVDEHNIEYIFSEKMVDSRVADTIATETGAEVMVLNPVAGSTGDDGYIPIMEQNLAKLETALECQ